MPVPFLRPHALVVIAVGVAYTGASAQVVRTDSTLPPVPEVHGPLRLSVVYPPAGGSLTAWDSTFIFGSTGSGRASLTVDGRSVRVWPNGAFLGFVPLPADTAASLRLVAALGPDTVAREHRVRLPGRFVPPRGNWLERASIEPRGNLWVERGERVAVSLNAAAGATVSLRLPDGTAVPLASEARRGGARARTRYSGSFEAVPLGVPLPTVTSPGVPAASDGSMAELLVTLARDTIRARLPVRLGVLDPGVRPVVLLHDDTAGTGTSRGTVVGRPNPGGPYQWFFPNGTVAAVSGRWNDELRLALSHGAAAWVSLAEVAGAVEGATRPWATLAAVRLTSSESAVTARLALGARIPVLIEEGPRNLTVLLYGAQPGAGGVAFEGTDTLVTHANWMPAAADEMTVGFTLSRPLFGYRVAWDGDDLVLDIRRPPVVDGDGPLRGRVIAIDPGHPPGGATGPTGLTEAAANLSVALSLRRLLEDEGARVVMTRATDTALGLYERTRMAEAEGADALVSIHNNAFPDGVNPFHNHGTSTYYFHPRSVRLATLVQDGMLRHMGLRDLGALRGSFALTRPTWMPAVLTEGAFMMIPEQENALRDPSFRERYARGVVEGLREFFRGMSRP